MNTENDKVVQAALAYVIDTPELTEAHIRLLEMLRISNKEDCIIETCAVILAAEVRSLDHKLEIAQRDAGVYCAANVLAARELGIDEDELEPHMLEHQVRALKKERDALQADKERLDWLETGPALPIDCSQEKGVEPEFQKRARLTRKSIDDSMQTKRHNPKRNGDKP